MENEELNKDVSKEEVKKDTKESMLEAIDNMKAENERRLEILRREEELQARRMLGGETLHPEEEKPKEETDHEYRTRIEQEIRDGKYL